MKHLAILVCALLLSSGALAQSAPEAEVRAVIEQLRLGGYEACVTRLEADAHLRSNAKQATAVDLALEGQRLACETLRMEGLADNLQGVREHLLAEAVRLDVAWETAHRISPAKYPDTPGRDASQRKLRADAALIGRSMANLRDDAKGREEDAVALMVSAIEAIEAFDEERRGHLVVAISVEAQSAIMQRIIGKLVVAQPPVVTPKAT